jgi:hypothetical protein
VDTRPPPRPKYGARRFQQVWFQQCLSLFNLQQSCYGFSWGCLFCG